MGELTNQMLKGCMFCERIENVGALADCTVYEDEFFHASHQVNDDGSPAYLGSVIIQARRHVHDLGGLTEREAESLGLLMKRVSDAVISTTGASWTYAECFLERYQHVHVIITARYPSMPKEYIRLAVRKWPDAPKGGQSKIVDLSRRLRAEISKA